VREVLEETGLVVAVAHLAGQVVRDGPDGVIFDIDDYVCTLVGGQLHADSDASDALWVTHAQLITLDLVPGLLAALTEWAALPA
jgi:8-oxo-dGTP pyrophosphatase MutT (NUDIX family)